MMHFKMLPTIHSGMLPTIHFRNVTIDKNNKLDEIKQLVCPVLEC